MRAVGYGLVGLVLGSVGGFWVGLMIGLIYTELASVSCFEGRCGYVAGGVGVLGAVLCGLAGAAYGWGRALRGDPAEASAFCPRVKDGSAIRSISLPPNPPGRASPAPRRSRAARA